MTRAAGAVWAKAASGAARESAQSRGVGQAPRRVPRRTGGAAVGGQGTADGFSFPLLPLTSNIMLFRLRGKKDLDHRATLVQTVSVQ